MHNVNRISWVWENPWRGVESGAVRRKDLEMALMFFFANNKYLILRIVE